MEDFRWLIASDAPDFNEEIARFFEELPPHLTPRQRQNALYAVVLRYQEGSHAAPPKP